MVFRVIRLKRSPGFALRKIHLKIRLLVDPVYVPSSDRSAWRPSAAGVAVWTDPSVRLSASCARFPLPAHMQRQLLIHLRGTVARLPAGTNGDPCRAWEPHRRWHGAPPILSSLLLLLHLPHDSRDQGGSSRSQQKIEGLSPQGARSRRGGGDAGRRDADVTTAPPSSLAYRTGFTSDAAVFPATRFGIHKQWSLLTFTRGLCGDPLRTLGARSTPPRAEMDWPSGLGWVGPRRDEGAGNSSGSGRVRSHWDIPNQDEQSYSPAEWPSVPPDVRTGPTSLPADPCRLPAPPLIYILFPLPARVRTQNLGDDQEFGRVRHHTYPVLIEKTFRTPPSEMTCMTSPIEMTYRKSPIEMTYRKSPSEMTYRTA
ncbi:hypothetical protein SKAU_G00408760 [Synaphobranchus kaupii]|uniref:Uncharacterized protein n=1 Tax=Synaphobranchus kaupii TaxID=118154 RepID=A0A9Q1ID48_SYNKA|nr:hypothetical protein SKAU_G00408760 [Synaphobranchus kaupii]